MTRVLDIPTVDYSAAHSAALRTRRAGTAADACLDDLAAALAPAWAGVASQAYLDGRAMVSREATALSQACDAMSRGIVDFADEAAAVLPGWRRDAERLAQLERGATDPAVLGIDPADVVAVEATITERDRLREAVAVWERRYDEAGMQLASACHRATALLDDGVLSTADQLWAIPTTLMDELVVAPLRLGAMLLDDPSQADDVVVAQWYALKDQVEHPVRTADEMAGGPQYRDGEWGEGTGQASASVIGLFGLRRMLAPDGSTTILVRRQADARENRRTGTEFTPGGYRDLTQEEAIRYARHIQDRNAPMPRTQTLDEMRAGVDLSRSEHNQLGHTLSRHVDVDMDYLMFRLYQGTPTNRLRVDEPPPVASAWTDQATAERAITDALNAPQNQAALRAFEESSGNGSCTLVLARDDLGVVASRDQYGAVRYDVADHVEVILRRRDGNIFVATTKLTTGEG